MIPNRVPTSGGYINVVVGGPGRGKRGHPKGRLVGSHRVAWEAAFGPIPEGMWVLHHCDNRACSEPTHLFLGNHLANMADMRAKGRGAGKYTGATHCVNGHAFTPANTYRYLRRDGYPGRACRICRRAADRRHRAKNRT